MSIAASLGMHPEEIKDVPFLENVDILKFLEELRILSDDTGFALISGEKGKHMGPYV